MLYTQFKYLFISFVLIAGSTSCEKLFFQNEPDDDPVALFEYFWTAYNENYAVFDERHVNWDSLYEQYRPMISNLTTEDELYFIIT